MVYKAKKILIVDGYNVLRCGEKYTELAGESPNFRDWENEIFNAAREALFNDVTQFIDKNWEAIIVYDAAKRIKNLNESLKPQKVGNVETLFSKPGEQADELIQRLAFNARSKGFEITIVSSDAEIQYTTMHKGVNRMSAKEFCKISNNILSEAIIESKKSQGINPSINNTPTNTNVFTSTIETQVDASTAKKLKQLRDSL